MSSQVLLETRGLRVSYRDGSDAARQPVQAVDGLDLKIHAGETVGVLGESGCGKTSLALAIAGLLPPNGEIAGGEIRWLDARLDHMAESELLRLRGSRIGVVFQDPALALHPMRRVGAQIAEVAWVHRREIVPGEVWDRRQCHVAALESLTELGFDDPPSIATAYPHQLSGGQRQRVVLAQALVCRPALLLADEPTAALDLVVRAQVLDLLKRLRQRSGIASLHISHAPSVLAAVADRVAVMYSGQIVEEGACEEVLEAPRHPYTRALLDCQPKLPSDPEARETGRDADDGAPGRKLPAIPGTAPSLAPPPAGCRFAPRCALAEARCRTEPPPERSLETAHRVACWLA